MRKNRYEIFGNTVYDTKTNKIINFLPSQDLANCYNFDPTVFAWNVDPLAHEFTSWSPYAAFGDNPIKNIDPDGKAFFVADKAQQTTVLQYLNEQLGSGLFSFKNNGNLKLDKKAYKGTMGGMNENQKSLAEGMIRVMNSNRIVEARLYDGPNVNFSTNPQTTTRNYVTDPETGQKRVEFTNTAKYQGGRGIVIPTLDQEALTLYEPGDDRAYILFDKTASSTGTFDAVGGGKTNPSPSSLFLHEILDHGEEYIKTGNSVSPSGTPAERVKNHNKALDNVGSPVRDGITDHAK